MSATHSVAALTSASTGLVNSRSRRCLGSEPEFTPTRSGVPWRLAASTTSPVFSGPPMLPGVDAHAVRPGLDGLDGQRVVEVDVGDHGDRRVVDDRLQRLDVLLARDGDADDVGPGLGDPADLVHRGAEIGRLGLGHRLDGHGCAAPDGDAADVDLPRRGHGLECTRRAGAHREVAPAAGTYAPSSCPTSTAPRAGACARAWPLPWPPAPGPGAMSASSPSRASSPACASSTSAAGRWGCADWSPSSTSRASTSPRARTTRAVRAGRRDRAPALRRRRLRPRLQLERRRARRPARRAAFAAEIRRVARGWFVRRRRGRSRSSPTRCCPSPTGCRRRCGAPTGAWAPPDVGGHRAPAPLGARRALRRAGPRRAPRGPGQELDRAARRGLLEKLIHSPSLRIGSQSRRTRRARRWRRRATCWRWSPLAAGCN